MKAIAFFVVASLTAASSQAGTFEGPFRGVKARAAAVSTVSDKKMSAAAEAVPAERGVEVLHCEANPGTRFCRKIDRIVSLMGMECRGAGCYALFDRIRYTLASFVEMYDEEAPAKYRASKELGAKSKAAARGICGSVVTGAPADVTAIAMAMNEALPLLKEFQVKAGDKSPKSCVVSVQ
jgi:hypothetical protein